VIRAFNAFQLVCLFAGLPFGIGYLHGNPFPYSPAAFYVAIVAYLVLFVVLCLGVYDLTESK
jgi:hypothetical protein